jgi:GDP/UDP-N,N'-diacetylbacillosamine 2-epimerase (hydrolysing)
MKKRKIIAITGARSEYDLLYSTYKQLNLLPDVEFGLIITGPHLADKFGNTGSKIEDDGFIIYDRLYNLIDTNNLIGRISSLGYQIPLLAHALNRIRPDIVIVAGDREEAISVSMTAAFLNIPVAHFFGGDIAKDGNIDNSVRYAASKFSHLHFTTLEQHKENLLRLGEDDWRIHVVGNPALDRIKEIPMINRDHLFSLLESSNWVGQNYCVLIQHSVINEVNYQDELIRVTLDSILDSGYRCFINYPNSDAGNQPIIEAYQEYQRLYPDKFKLFQNLDRKLYINLLRNASFLIGNSSSGLLEAPSLKLPAINVGTRQRGREHGDNVVFVDYNKSEIINAIKLVTCNKEFIDKVQNGFNPYGDGNSTKKIIEILKNVEINEKLIFKNITY